MFYVDFYKAFDWVNRNKILNLLTKYGCCGKMFRSLKAIYSSIKAAVVIKSATDNNDKKSNVSYQSQVTSLV